MLSTDKSQSLYLEGTSRLRVYIYRLLRDLTQSNAYIQRLLELDVSGYVELPNRWSCLTHAGKLEILRNNRFSRIQAAA